MRFSLPLEKSRPIPLERSSSAITKILLASYRPRKLARAREWISLSCFLRWCTMSARLKPTTSKDWFARVSGTPASRRSSIIALTLLSLLTFSSCQRPAPKTWKSVYWATEGRLDVFPYLGSNPSLLVPRGTYASLAACDGEGSAPRLLYFSWEDNALAIWQPRTLQLLRLPIKPKSFGSPIQAVCGKRFYLLNMDQACYLIEPNQKSLARLDEVTRAYWSSKTNKLILISKEGDVSRATWQDAVKGIKGTALTTLPIKIEDLSANDYPLSEVVFVSEWDALVCYSPRGTSIFVNGKWKYFAKQFLRADPINNCLWYSHSRGLFGMVREEHRCYRLDGQEIPLPPATGYPQSGTDPCISAEIVAPLSREKVTVSTVSITSIHGHGGQK